MKMGDRILNNRTWNLLNQLQARIWIAQNRKILKLFRGSTRRLWESILEEEVKPATKRMGSTIFVCEHQIAFEIKIHNRRGIRYEITINTH